MNSFVLLNFLAGFFLKGIMAEMFASINSLQITAHIPLMNFNVPAPAYFIFDILIQIVAFDFLPITSLINFGYSRTEPFHDKFVWLGYEESNFIHNLGSLSLFLTYFLLKGVFVVIFACCACCKRRFSRLQNFLDST